MRMVGEWKFWVEQEVVERNGPAPSCGGRRVREDGTGDDTVPD